MSRRSRIVVILEVAQTSVCVPVNHIAVYPFAEIAGFASLAANRKEN
jgi:hypothetical protein